jgi:hypothetical protein
MHKVFDEYIGLSAWLAWPPLDWIFKRKTLYYYSISS